MALSDSPEPDLGGFCRRVQGGLARRIDLLDLFEGDFSSGEFVQGFHVLLFWCHTCLQSWAFVHGPQE